MCFSFRVSIATGVVCWMTALIKLSTSNDDAIRHRAIFLLIYSSVQYADAILWAHPTHDMVNKWTTSYLVPALLSTQLLYNAHVQRTDSMLPYIPAVALSAYMFWRLHGYTTPACCTLKSPVWGGSEFHAWEFGVFSFLVLYPSWGTWAMSIVLISTIALTTSGGYGSMWCSLACLEAVRLWGGF